MRDAARDHFAQLTARYEGRKGWMYLDTHDPPLVTTGVGNLIDPVSEALKLPWQRGGDPASPAEIEADWARVKAMPGGMKAEHYLDGGRELRLTEEAIDELERRKLDAFWGVISNHFPGAEDWPADGQLGVVMMVWALGMGELLKDFPKFCGALALEHWEVVARECDISTAHEARNQAHRLCFLNAARSLDPDTLYFPGEVPATGEAQVG